VAREANAEESRRAEEKAAAEALTQLTPEDSELVLKASVAEEREAARERWREATGLQDNYADKWDASREALWHKVAQTRGSWY
jgi:hypothetical protein